MKVLFPSTRNYGSYDPANIQYSDQACFINSVLERVFYYDQENQLRSHCLESTSYQGHTWKLYFKDSLKTSKGDSWGAFDFYLSLKRLILINRSLHNDLATLLDPQRTLKKLEDDLESLQLNENSLSIQVDSQKKAILEEMFATHESSVLYRDNFNHLDLKIEQYFNTTGSYCADPNNENRLIPNSNYPTNIKLQEIEFVPRKKSQDVFQAFKDSDADILPSISVTNAVEIYRRVKDNSKFDFKLGPAHSLVTLSFSKDSNLSRLEKISTGKVFKEAYCKKFFIEGFCNEANQFFTRESIFHLPETELAEYKDLLAASAVINKDKVIRFKIKDESARSFFEDLLGESIPNLVLTTEDRFDVSLHTTDTGAFETYSPIIYFSSIGMFHLPKDTNEVLKNFSDMSLSERKSEGQRIHKQALEDGDVFPIFFTPTISVSKLPYRFINNPGSTWNIIKE